MAKEKKIRTERTLQKAIDKALWLNFKHRMKKMNFKVVHNLQDHYLITVPKCSVFDDEDFEVLPKDYAEMTYEQIRKIASDESPLMHWEEVKGTFSTMHGELLRFILHYNVPLEKFIRWELACRGHDKDHKWCGFEKAEKLWLEE